MLRPDPLELLDHLQQIGLTTAEAKVYLTLLQLGDTTSGPIIRESGVSRSKVYELLEKLHRKGLITTMAQEDAQHFQATRPERILEYLGKQREHLAAQEDNVKRILPTLTALQRELPQQEVRAYVGIEGIKSYFNEALSRLEPDDEYLAMTFREDQRDDTLNLLFQQFHHKRAEKGVGARILAPRETGASGKAMDYTATGNYQLRTTTQKLPAGIAIYKECVATFIWGNTPKVFVITCAQNAAQYRDFFEEAWASAKATPAR